MSIKRQSSEPQGNGRLAIKKRKHWTVKNDFKPFIRTEFDASSDPKLCERCRLIDFQAILMMDGQSLPKYGIPVFQLSLLTESMLFSLCPICRIFAAMVYLCEPGREAHIYSPRKPQDLAKGTYHLRAMYIKTFWDEALRSECLIKSHSTYDLASASSVVVALYAGKPTKNLTSWQGYNYHRGVILPMFRHQAGDATKLSTEARIVPQKLCAQSVRMMLEDCEANHITCAALSLNYPADARVIDCKEKKIVSLEPNQRYLALSYVWGDASGAEGYLPAAMCRDESYLPATLPLTIQDALEITRNLGFRYLWVDRYCIKQFHAQDKERQIANMANIYACASATICALGENESAGIFGASQIRHQLTATVSGIELGWAGCRLLYMLRSSMWSTRGWTLQESVLSRRCLFFTMEGVVLVCLSGVLNENNVRNQAFHSDLGNVTREQIFFSKSSSLPTTLTDPKKFHRQRFISLRSEYLERTLGYNKDSLNAFRAILIQLKEFSYWGIVLRYRCFHVGSGGHIQFDSHIDPSFIASLSWYVEYRPAPLRKSRWQSNVPSWSWITQANEVGEAVLSEDIFDDRSFWTSISILQTDGTRQKLRDYFSTIALRSALPERSTVLCLRSHIARWESSRETGVKNEYQIRFSWTSNNKWSSLLNDEKLNQGTLILDCKPLPTSIVTSGLGENYPRSGYAILLNGSPALGKYYWACWLAIRKSSNQNFLREGLIRSWPDGLEPVPDGMDAIPEAGMKTIYLG